MGCLAAAYPALALAATPPASPGLGPRRRIGVRPFEAGPSFSLATENLTRSSPAEVLALIEAAFFTRLGATGCCTVAPRDEMAPLFATIDKARPLASSGPAAPPVGEVLPAQFVLTTSLTLMSPPDFDHSIPEFGGGGVPGHRRDFVELGVRLNDTGTAMALGVYQAEHGLPGGTLGPRGDFFASSLGQATDIVLTDVVAQIAAALAAIPWRGQIVKSAGGMVWVNAGDEDGVGVGDRFAVGRYGEALADPETGALVNKVRLGVVAITKVEPHLAMGVYRPSAAGAPARCDWLTMLPK